MAKGRGKRSNVSRSHSVKKPTKRKASKKRYVRQQSMVPQQAPFPTQPPLEETKQPIMTKPMHTEQMKAALQKVLPAENKDAKDAVNSIATYATRNNLSIEFVGETGKKVPAIILPVNQETKSVDDATVQKVTKFLNGLHVENSGNPTFDEEGQGGWSGQHFVTPQDKAVARIKGEGHIKVTGMMDNDRIAQLNSKKENPYNPPVGEQQPVAAQQVLTEAQETARALAGTRSEETLRRRR